MGMQTCHKHETLWDPVMYQGCPLCVAETESLLNGLAQECYRIAASKGWHDAPNPIDQRCMLLVTEIAEMYETYRTNPDAPCNKGIACSAAEEELADIVIRALDMAVEFKLDIGKAVFLKMGYNRSRPHMHGGKKF